MKAVYNAPAPAKLNLFLHVIGRRDDGYHLLQSVFQLIDWCDTLHFERRGDALLRRHDLGESLPDDDLCLRAARALQQHSGTCCGVDISIEKHLPSGAGMGGGSSDAATTLLVLNRLWDLNWSRSRLAALALSLGADVPFFVGGESAWVEGIGEQISPIALPEQRFAVIKPAGSIATQRIFSSPLLKRDSDAAILAGYLERDQTSQLATGYGRNDLQPAAEAECDEVRQACAWLYQRHGNSRMTGSGSAVFARIASPASLVRDESEELLRVDIDARPEATTLPDLPAQWVGRECRGLQQHPLHGWAADGR